MNGRTSERNSFRICVGSGSNEQDLVGVAEIIFPISSAEYGSKLAKTAGDDDRLDSAGIPSAACRTDPGISSVAYRTDANFAIEETEKIYGRWLVRTLIFTGIRTQQGSDRAPQFLPLLGLLANCKWILEQSNLYSICCHSSSTIIFTVLDLPQQAIHAVTLV